MLIVFIVFIILVVLGHFRNEYTHARMTEAINVVYRYNFDLIETGNYTKDDASLDYDKAIYNYFVYYFTIALWGKFTGIKPEYKEMLKPYLY